MKERCVKALSEVGASEAFCNFFADLLQCEFDMNTTLQRVLYALREEKVAGPDTEKVLKSIQELMRSFNKWKGEVDQLTERGRSIPALQLDQDKLSQSKVLKALCSLETGQVHVKEGDEIIVTDASQPNRLKVRTSSGQEGYVPALCCILPAPDRNPKTAGERLRVQLLVNWRESAKKVRAIVFHCLNASSNLTNDLKTQNGSTVATERVARRFNRMWEQIQKAGPHCDLNKLHQGLYSLERELTTWNNNGTDLGKMIDAVATLDKCVLCYQMFRKQYLLYRKKMEESVARPIHVVDRLSAFRNEHRNKNYKYYEMKTTLENVEVKEEILYITPDTESWASSSMMSERSDYGSRKESVETDQITSTEREEKKKFVIRAVVDPQTGHELSLRDAIVKGIVDQENGLYVNKATGEKVSIPEAMNQGQIKVEYVSTRRTEEKVKAVGLITIKTMKERPYKITKVIDGRTGERIDLEEAKIRGVVDIENDIYNVHYSGEELSIDMAIDGGWILVEYEDNSTEPQWEIKTFAISAVVDQRLKKKVPFYDAVRRGLIEKDTGNYVNNVTRERIYVTEAIRLGFLKAKQVDDASGLDIDAENKVVVERMEKIKKSILKPVAVINAFRAAAKAQ